ncbi:hypothetical protein K438DRAFT_1783367 [Mycena galopus ATCC 62051]|nr:hypothetical protein K438DRAFT_1783367 [Mycena galopus ATCC 62051]
MSSSQHSLFYRPYLLLHSTQTTFVIGSSHSLSHWITAHPLPANPALFDGPDAEAQHATTELLLYSTTLGESGQHRPLVGDKVVPPGHLAEYLQRENLYWPCFCPKGFDSGPKLLCRILTWNNEITVAVYHHDQPCCQFSLCSKPEQHLQEYVPLSLSNSLLARKMLSEKPGDLNPAKNWLAGYLGEAGASQTEVFIVGIPELFFPKYLMLTVSDVDGLDENEVKLPEIDFSLSIQILFLNNFLSGSWE